MKAPRRQFGTFAEIHHRTDIPRRTDPDDLPNYRTHKHAPFGTQQGHCAGCRMMFPFRNFEIDDMIPRAKDGWDHVENLQTALPGLQPGQGNQNASRAAHEAQRAGTAGCMTTRNTLRR